MTIRPPQPHERATMLVVSTACLSPTTCNEWLHSQLGDAQSIAFEKASYGWFIHVPDAGSAMDTDKRVPHDLRQLYAVARHEYCSWVMLDRDADVHPLLPVFDWGEG